MGKFLRYKGGRAVVDLISCPSLSDFSHLFWIMMYVTWPNDVLITG